MIYGTTSAILKRLAEVVLPDPRFAYAVMTGQNETRPFDVSDIHQRLCLTELNPAVPANVQEHFQTALNLMLYSWFVFEFQTVAEKHAYASLEFALRERFPDATRTIRKGDKTETIAQTLGPLLRRAVKDGLIVAESLPAWERVKKRYEFQARNSPLPVTPLVSPNVWLEHLVETLPNFRNDLAHGSNQLYFEASFWALEICADLINAIFPKPNGPENPEKE